METAMRTLFVHGFNETPRSLGREPSPRRRRRTLRADRSLLGRLAWSVVFAAIKIAGVASAVAAGGLVIALGLTLWFSPAAYFGWIWWAFVFTPLGMCVGAIAADAAELAIRLVNRAGDALLYRYGA